MNKYLRTSLLILLSIFLFSGCQLFDKEEQVPTYLYIDSVGVNPNYVDFGTSSHNISDVWVYINDQLVGCYELPARIPILAEGSNKLTFVAGVRVNGMSATRATYPFFAIKNYDVFLRSDSAMYMKPVFDYIQSSQIAFNEDFESAGIIFEKSIGSDTTIEATNAPENVFINTQDPTETSNYSGVINLNSTKDNFEIETINRYSLPKNGTYIFLEMNYKCTTPILVGTKAYYSSSVNINPLIGLNPTNTWKKVYINLTSAISSEINATNFKIYFSGSLRSGATEDKVLFDNIKVIHSISSKR